MAHWCSESGAIIDRVQGCYSDCPSEVKPAIRYANQEKRCIRLFVVDRQFGIACAQVVRLDVRHINERQRLADHFKRASNVRKRYLQIANACPLCRNGATEANLGQPRNRFRRAPSNRDGKQPWWSLIDTWDAVDMSLFLMASKLGELASME